MDLSKIEMEFWDNYSLYNKLEEEARHILEEEIDENEIKIHSILSRVKEPESFLQKVERKKYENPFEEIKDIVGLRVVCLFLSDIKEIEKIIKDNFKLLEEENKVHGNQLEFGYMSYHYTVTLKDNFSGYRYDKIKGFPFEIQVRTISMDAWANISHYLNYKTENDVPAELRKDFNAISGLFYVADTHFELFYKESQRNKIEIEHNIENFLVDKTKDMSPEINFDSLKIYLTKKFPERKRATEHDISSFIEDLILLGYRNINELDEDIERGLDAGLQYEKDNTPLGRMFNEIGITRMIMAIVNEDFRNKHYIKDTHDRYRGLVK